MGTHWLLDANFDTLTSFLDKDAFELTQKFLVKRFTSSVKN